MVPSPCINVCQMNPDTGLCRGCWRTLDEIARWSVLADSERLGILAAIARRRQPVHPGREEQAGP